jgi:hypothetical protein
LHVAIAERPVLTPVIHQVDPDVLFADAGLCVNFVGDAPVELLLVIAEIAPRMRVSVSRFPPAV